MALEIGIDTFGDVTRGPDGEPVTPAQTLRHVVEQAVLADRVGLDVVGIGEHHRDDFAISAPEVVLAAVAARTERIRLVTAVVVLSSDDPVRVYERFATLHALSDGRAELGVGRGSFTESFPLFGYSIEDYDELFDEKLELLAALLAGGPITWSGRLRSPLTDQRVHPALDGRPRVWVGVGGSPESAIRAARYGMSLGLAIIGSDPVRFRPFVDLYHRTLAEFGTGPGLVSQHSTGHVAESDAKAKDQLWPHYREQTARIGAERGWPEPTRDAFEEAAGPAGALFVGSPETVAAKMVRSVRVLGLDRITLKIATGRLPHEHVMQSIELLGTRVAPRVREVVGG